MAELKFSLRDTLLKLLDEKRYYSLRDLFNTMNPADIATVFEDIDEARLPLLFRLLPKELAAETFVEMEPELQELLIRGFSDSELKEVIDELYVDDAVDIVEEMPANVVQRILTQAEPEMRKQINEILRYPENSAGSIMTTEYVSLRPNMTVEEAILRIRRTGIDKETIYTCYVTRGHKLIGLVTVKDLLLCEDDEATIESIMQEHVISVNTLDDQEQVAQMFSKYNFLALPVVDTENRLVGIITFDDAMDVMEDETTEDMEKMAAMLPSEHPYMRSSPFEIWKNRIPWLLLLMVSATLTGLVITKFEDALGILPCLTAFIPMLMDTGGNAGSQACVSIIRGISLNEIEFGDLFHVVWKEIRVAVLCGVCLAAACFGKIMLVDHLLLQNTSVTTTVALVVCISMAMTVFMAKVVGSVLPLLAKKIGLDPAVMASPLITTIVDFLSLMAYFSVAVALLPQFRA
ncbi:mg2+ transporter (MgtE) [Firmicutes bacterium CAG:170]|nr:magnesium transporter [Oscillospiraceae bacterium]CDB88401.1 mg2+ transporter (MgtE) [Firmicutes bacterium CAG:170]